MADHGQAKVALIAAHQGCLHHCPARRDSTLCVVCAVPLPCPTVLHYVAVMVAHGHLTDDLERKRVEHGEHGCDAWIWPYRY